MIGELIPTGVTFGVGRNSINDAFSGTAEFNNIIINSISATTVSATTVYTTNFNVDSIIVNTISATTVSTTNFNVNSITGDTIQVDGQIYSPIYSVTTGTTFVPDFNNGNVLVLTLSGATTLNSPVNMKDGATYTIFVNQDSIGGNALTWGGYPTYLFSNGVPPTTTTTASAINMHTFISDGSFMYHKSTQSNLQSPP